MTEATVVDQDTVHELMTAEQKELLDAVDALRRENIDADIDIPQIVVCGNQSSGKSSVLEALAQVQFPIGHGTITRFPIEVILRHSSVPGIEVKLCASNDRKEKKKEIEEFSPGFAVTGPEDFPRLVEAATKHLQKVEPTSKFWSDWLRAEISGPKQPHLTLVDLPGLIYNDKSSDVNPGDMDKIKKLVTRFMRAPRTMVVAIFDALCDKDLQNILGLVAESPHDVRARTIGVITKPDRLTPGSDMQKAVLKLARNEEIHLGLGWHVVRNVEHEDGDRTKEHHDQVEGDFFSTGEWATLGRAKTGIASLRQRLSQGLLKCITGGLQSFLSDMDGKLKSCKDSRDRLGPGRPTVNEQRAYLNDIMERFARLVEASLDGDYFKREFQSFYSDANNSKVREKIHSVLGSFALDMAEKGQTRVVQGRPVQISLEDLNYSITTEVATSQTSLFGGSDTGKKSGGVPQFSFFTANDTRVKIEDYCKEVATKISAMRGKNLPAQVPGSALRAIFHEQSSSWEKISRHHLDACITIVYAYVRLAAFHVAGPHTGGILLQKYMLPGVDLRAQILQKKLTQLLWPYRNSHPMTYSSRYETAVANLTTVLKRKEDAESRPEVIVRHAPFTAYALLRKWNVDLVNAAEAIDRTEAYYCLARDTFIENVPTLAVEACLLADLDDILPKQEIWKLDDEEVSSIAAEPKHIQNEREELLKQIKALENAITTCRRHADQEYELPVSSKSMFDATPHRQPDPFHIQSKPASTNGERSMFGNSGSSSGGHLFHFPSTPKSSERRPPRATPIDLAKLEKLATNPRIGGSGQHGSAGSFAPEVQSGSKANTPETST